MILCVCMWNSKFCVVSHFYMLIHSYVQSYSHYGELFEDAWRPFTKQPRLRISDFAGQRVRCNMSTLSL